MSLRDSQFGELKVPLTWTAAAALVVAAVIAAALLMTDRRETLEGQAYGALRGATDSVLAPVGDALSAPGRWTGAGIEAIRGYFFAVSENRRLKAELKEMRQWRDVALALKNENGRFRSLLGLKTDPPIPMVAARVVTDARGPFADTRIANAGSDAGVRPGNPVMSEYGLVGRVIGVTGNASRVLMVTDVASRTPVMVDRTNARAILTGDGGPNPRLDYLRGQEPVREGDRIITSGDGGILPRGLPVGFAVKGLDGKWRVVLASDKGPIDFVRILLFQDFTQVINRAQMDELTPPPPTPGSPVEAAPPTATPPAAAPAPGAAPTTAAGATAGAAATRAAAPPSAAPSAARPSSAGATPATPRPAALPRSAATAGSAATPRSAASGTPSRPPSSAPRPSSAAPSTTARPPARPAARPSTAATRPASSAATPPRRPPSSSASSSSPTEVRSAPAPVTDPPH